MVSPSLSCLLRVGFIVVVVVVVIVRSTAAFAFSASHPATNTRTTTSTTTTTRTTQWTTDASIFGRAAFKYKTNRSLQSSNNNDDNNDDNDDNDNDQYQNVEVAGVSVSPHGFLVLLRSKQIAKKTMAFPIQITSSRDPSSSASSSSTSSPSSSSSSDSEPNAELPELFRENNDQTSVTSAEALTFLQLLNGVDMATPILGPDTLSSIVVSHAFLTAGEDRSKKEENSELPSNNETSETNNDDDGGGLEVVVMEDELGLLSTDDDDHDDDDHDDDDDDDDDDESQSALEYVRAMVRTTLPPGLDYSDASPWQRARVKMPRAWLRGVRLEMAETSEEESNDDGCRFPDGEVGIIGRVPVRFVLECSVDDGSKRLEIPLFAVPSSSSSSSSSQSKPSSLQQQQREQLEISEEILRELSNDYNGETSASFVSLALFHRYAKSNAGNAAVADEGPALRASIALLLRLEGMQEKDGQTRYCWSGADGVGGGDDDDNGDFNSGIDSIIRSAGLPLYRTLSQIQEEDQRVLQHLEEQNFDSDGDTSIGDNDNNNNNNNNRNSDNSPQRDQRKERTLTAKQQTFQQTLKSAWKIATQKEDTKALEKIRKAMEDLEREVTENDNARNVSREDEDNDDDDDDASSSLTKIQRAMRESNGNDGENEEDSVGLILELEEATTDDRTEDASDARDEAGE